MKIFMLFRYAAPVLRAPHEGKRCVRIGKRSSDFAPFLTAVPPAAVVVQEPWANKAKQVLERRDPALAAHFQRMARDWQLPRDPHALKLWSKLLRRFELTFYRNDQ